MTRSREVERRMETDTVRFQIGPIAATAVRSWLMAARPNLLRVTAACKEALPFKMPQDVSDRFVAVLDAWAAAADASETFEFEDELEVDTVSRLFVYWLNLASFSRDQRARLGLIDAPADSAAFADAVRASMLQALSNHGSLERLGEFVHRGEGWS